MSRRRSLIVSASKLDLPDGYKMIEYLQSQTSDAKQYIDTEYVYDIDSYIDLYNLKQEEKKLVVENLDKGSIREIVTDDTFETEKMNLFLFASHSKLNPIDSAPREYSKGLKVYSFSITKNGEKVVDLVPCLDNKKVPCFYDKARKKTLYNAGTGEFITGDEV